MQTGPGSSSNRSGGGGGLSRSGLARFHSAPTTWLEALLEDEQEDPLKPSQCLTQLVADDLASPSSTTNSLPFASSADLSAFDAEFLRQNSPPVDFIDTFGSISEGYFSSYGIPASFDSVPPNIRNSTAGNKRSREVEMSQNFSPKRLSHVKEEQGGVSSTTMGVEMDKIFEDSVPCRVRAKRGFATHPRSIAERVRRTRISDRIRKLEELVPNMDKQTNTADMLEEAVAYVKDLQKQIEELSELQTRCTCSAKE